MFLALKERLFGRGGDASKSVARSRLHFVLVQDRTGLTNEEMARFKSEMIGVIEKYFVIDKSGFDISYKREVETTTLLINSPVVVRRRGDDESSNKKATVKKIKAAATAEAPAPEKTAEAESSEEPGAPLAVQP